MKEDGTGNYHIGSVVKALRILDRLAESPASLKVLEQDLSLSTTTTYRIVKTLQSYRLIRQDQSTGLMSLDYKFQEFSNKLDEQLPLLRMGKRYLLELNSQYDETVNLAILEGTWVRYVGFMESTKPLRTGAHLGDRLPAHSTALGKALLSGKRNQEIATLYSDRTKLTAQTPKTICTLDELVAEIEKVRASGIAYDREEAVLGIKCAACPIRGQEAKIIAALSFSMPAQRAKGKRFGKMVASLQDAAVRMSDAIAAHE